MRCRDREAKSIYLWREIVLQINTMWFLTVKTHFLRIYPPGKLFLYRQKAQNMPFLAILGLK